MNNKYEIRIFRERFNVNSGYYTSNNKEDILLSVFANSYDELMQKWKELLEEYEGETYSVWDHTTNEVITGGAYDPSDFEYIDEYFEK